MYKFMKISMIIMSLLRVSFNCAIILLHYLYRYDIIVKNLCKCGDFGDMYINNKLEQTANRKSYLNGIEKNVLLYKKHA